VSASETVRPSPGLMSSDFGYGAGAPRRPWRPSTNDTALARTLASRSQRSDSQIRRNMNWLRPRERRSLFIGLMGDGMDITELNELSAMNSTSLPARPCPGISNAMIAPPRTLRRHPRRHLLQLVGPSFARLAPAGDFSLEFLKLAERSFGEQ